MPRFRLILDLDQLQLYIFTEPPPTLGNTEEVSNLKDINKEILDLLNDLMRLKGAVKVLFTLSLCVFLCIKIVEISSKNPSDPAWRDTGTRAGRISRETARKNASCLQRPDSHRLSVLQRARLEDVRTEPFPYIVIKDALPEPIYAALEQHFLSDAELVAETTGSETQRMRSNYRYSAKADALLSLKKQSKIKRVPTIIREFAQYHTSSQFAHEVLWLFRSKLGEYRPDLLRKLHDVVKNGEPNWLASPDKNSGKHLIKTEVELVINSPVFQSPSSVRGYHHDKLNEIFAGLLYMRKKGDHTPGGNFQILRCKHECRKVPENAEIKRRLGIATTGRHEQYDPKTLELDNEVVYGRNTLAMFINSPVSVHAVTARPKTKFARRYINVNADLKLRQSEIVKEEDCLKSGTGYSCRDNVDESDSFQLTTSEAVNQIVGLNC